MQQTQHNQSIWLTAVVTDVQVKHYFIQCVCVCEAKCKRKGLVSSEVSKQQKYPLSSCMYWVGRDQLSQIFGSKPWGPGGQKIWMDGKDGFYSLLTWGQGYGISQYVAMAAEVLIADPYITGPAQHRFYCTSPGIKTSKQWQALSNQIVAAWRNRAPCVFVSTGVRCTPFSPSQLSHISVHWAEVYINKHSSPSKNGSQRGEHQVSSGFE